jgi:hypothetical protein
VKRCKTIWHLKWPIDQNSKISNKGKAFEVVNNYDSYISVKMNYFGGRNVAPNVQIGYGIRTSLTLSYTNAMRKNHL